MASDDTHDIQTFFKRQFGHPPVHEVRAPGRLELLGNHTDYNDGLVMALAVDRYIYVGVSPRKDGKVELTSSAYPERELFSVDDLKHNPAAPWASYVKGVLDQLRRRKIHFTGFNMAIRGTIPLGAGMSSSAALEVATALAVRQLYPFTLTESGLGQPPARDDRGRLPNLAPAERMHVAKLCRAAENEFVGVKCGLLDQISSLYGKAWSVVEIDCQSLAVDSTPMPGEAVIVCNSGAKHALVGGEYNELRENCESAARKLGARSLRSVDLKQVEAAKARLAPREYECARHVVSEIARVVAGARALRDDDHQQFGQFMFQSHESSRDYLKNSTKELDILVELARQAPGCLGARLTGGGFGGATLNLVAHAQAEKFITYMSRKYQDATGIGLTPIVCQIVNGAE